MRWTADGVKQLWDAFSTAAAVWWRFLRGMAVGDCDDFAVFICAVLLKSKKEGHCKDIVFVDIMTITWEKGGHNVALLTRDDGKMGVMDYKKPDWFNNAQEAKEFVLSKYAPGQACIGWTICDSETLKVHSFGDR